MLELSQLSQTKKFQLKKLRTKIERLKNYRG